MDPFSELGQMIREAAREDVPALLGRVTECEALLRLRLAEAPSTAALAADENVDVPTGARRLGMSPRYIYKHPELPFVLRIGRRLLLSSRGIDRYIAQMAGRA